MIGLWIPSFIPLLNFTAIKQWQGWALQEANKKKTNAIKYKQQSSYIRKGASREEIGYRNVFCALMDFNLTF